MECRWSSHAVQSAELPLGDSSINWWRVPAGLTRWSKTLPATRYGHPLYILPINAMDNTVHLSPLLFKPESLNSYEGNSYLDS